MNNKFRVHGGGIADRIPFFTFHTRDRWILGDNLPHKIQWLVLQLGNLEADPGMEFGMHECSCGKSRRKSGGLTGPQPTWQGTLEPESLQGAQFLSCLISPMCAALDSEAALCGPG